VKVSAPAGRFVFTGVESESVLLLAAGVGITPLMAMIRCLADSAWGGSVVLIFAARRRRDVIFSDELGRLAARFSWLHVFVTLSGEEDPSWSGLRGRITAELLRSAAPDAARRPVYLCGPEAMMAETRTLLLCLGVPDAQIRTEAFVSAATTGDMPVLRSAADETPAERAMDGAPLIVANEGMPAVTFRRSMKTADLPEDRTILEAAEDAGVDIPFECRSGICGQCKTRLLAGRVTMDVEDALSATDRSRGLILACQARSAWDVAVDA
jgi:ferredoxin-NADP reductase